MKLKLTPKNIKAAAVISRAGADIWYVTGTADTVGFSEKQGPWCYVRPDVNGQPTDQVRWVHRTDDADFVINEVKE